MRIIALSLVMAAVPTVGWAQASDDGQQACMGDAFTFCAAQIPDREQVRQCLVANRTQISAACRSRIDAGRSARTKPRE